LSRKLIERTACRTARESVDHPLSRCSMQSLSSNVISD